MSAKNICLKCPEHCHCTHILSGTYDYHINSQEISLQFQVLNGCFIKESNKIECWKCLCFNTIQCDRWEIFDKIMFIVLVLSIIHISSIFLVLSFAAAQSRFVLVFLFWTNFYTYQCAISIFSLSLFLYLSHSADYNCLKYRFGIFFVRPAEN